MGKIKSKGVEGVKTRDRPTITPYQAHSPGKDYGEGVNYDESDCGSRGLEVFVEPVEPVGRQRLSFIRRARSAEMRHRSAPRERLPEYFGIIYE